MRNAIPLFVLLIFLNSCFSAKYCSREIEVAQTDLGENVQEAFNAEAVLSVDLIPEEWWRLFGDEQLNRFIEVALECHPTIKEAEHRIALAYQIALEAKARLLPYIDGLGSIQREKLSLFEFGVPGLVPLLEPENLYFTLAKAILRGSWEIDVWGKHRNLFKSKLDETTAALADMIQAKLILSTTICSAYFNLQSHLKEYEILKQNVEDKKGVTELLRQRFERGVSSEFFLYEEDRDLALLVDALDKMEGTIEADKNALAALVMNPATLCDACLSLDVELSAHYDEPFLLPQTLPLDLIARRPDIRAHIWRIESGKNVVKASKARFYPNLDLFGSAGYASFLLAKFFNPKAIAFDGGARSILPIYTGGELTARLGQSQEELEIAVQQYNQTVIQAIREVSDALSSLITADNRKKDIARALIDAKSLYRLTAQKYDHGIETLVSVLNASSDVLVQELTAAQIHLARMEAIVDLIRSIGGGYCGC